MIDVGRSAVPRQRTRVYSLTLGAIVACLLVTAAILWSPSLLLGVHEPALHLVLDSVDASIATLVAYLLWGRFRREHEWRPLLLALGLLLLVLASVAGGISHVAGDDVVKVWWPQAIRVEGAVLVAAGALAGRRRIVLRSAGVVSVAVLALPVVTGAFLWAASPSLPVAVSASPPSAVTPVVTGHPALLLAHGVGALAFLLAAAVFTTEAVQSRVADPLLHSLGPACVLGAFSRVHYVLFPSIYSGWLYTGDLFRTACYLVLLAGAATEIAHHWESQTDLAVRADRRRLARELHDGVVQELGFIASESHAVTTREGIRIREAARRGLDEARAAVEALDHGEEESFTIQLHRLARQLTERYGVRVVVDLDVTVPVARTEAHALLRIAREAAGNAARHGGASSIGIGLGRDLEGRRLVVHDDGHGFDPDQASANGYGLTSMDDRARGLGGRLEVRSSPGRGTTVTVTW
jgi:signal transduction histidine kinase